MFGGRYTASPSRRATASALAPAVGTVLVVMLVLGGCSARAASGSGTSAVTTIRPTGPAAALTGPITTGHLNEPLSPVPDDLAAHGYVEEEFFASGTATAYQAVGSLPRHGRWTVKPQATAPYRTRIVVRRPSDPARFNGTVLVEWFNVTSGLEADPDWTYFNPELVRQGYAYVGVSAQAFGVIGGQALLGAAGSGLVASQPARYGTLKHPGDQFSYDMLSQIGRALRDTQHPPVLGSLHPKKIVAIGESQSAAFLTTYIDAVQATAHVYDGFFVHSRGSSGAALSGSSAFAASGVPAGLRIRTDLGVPVFMFETETDVGPLLDYGPARQPNTGHIRTWEVAGTAHADAYLVGNFAGLLGCTSTINEGPQHFVAKAALDALNRWVTHGTPPPTPPPLRLATTAPPAVARDHLGNAIGGVRTPAVDVPVSALSGVAPPGVSVLCSLFGSTVPFDGPTLAGLYHDKAGYLAAYTRSLDKTIAAGYMLAADRSALLAQAQGVQFP